MSRVKQVSKRKRRSKAGSVLAAGLSLSLASGASAATIGPAADMLTRNTAPSHEVALREEEIFDVSLATFCVFDKERGGAFQPGVRLAAGCAGGCGGCGCWTGTYYTSADTHPPAPPRPVRTPHKPVPNRP